MNKQEMRIRCAIGRVAARKSLAVSGETHRGKHGLGRKPLQIGKEVADWRKSNSASIAATAKYFELSVSTVKRYCAEVVARRIEQAAFEKYMVRDEQQTRDTDWLTSHWRDKAMEACKDSSNTGG